MAEPQVQDVVHFTPSLSKQVPKDELFLDDKVTPWFFDFIKGKFNYKETVEKVFEERKSHSKAKGKKVKRAKIEKIVLANIEEVGGFELIDGYTPSDLEDNTYKTKEYFFDPIYHIIVCILEKAPITKVELKQIYLEKIKEQNLEPKMEFKEYLKKLENSNYVRSTWSLLKEDRTRRLLSVIYQKPKTIKEIVTEYNDGLSNKDMKSENTIYRYLKTLSYAKLIENAGQRVTIGKTATETLYRTSAYLQLTTEYDKEIFKTEFGTQVSKLMSKLLKLLYPELEPKPECMEDILLNISVSLDDKTKEIVKLSEDVIEDLSEYKMPEINFGFRNAALIAWFYENPDLISDLIKCLSQSK